MGNSKMDEVQRFDQRCFAGHYEGIAPDDQGDYVLFEDYVKLRCALAAQAARIAELEEHCKRLGAGDAERYWEGRWRDADAELSRLRDAATPSEDGREVPEVVAWLDERGAHVPPRCASFQDDRKKFERTMSSNGAEPLMTVAQHSRIVAAKDAEIARWKGKSEEIDEICQGLQEIIHNERITNRNESLANAEAHGKTIAERDELRAQLDAQPARQVGGDELILGSQAAAIGVAHELLAWNRSQDKPPISVGLEYFVAQEAMRMARAALAPAAVVMPEPEGYLFQHEETGLVQVVDVQQVEWGFEQNNPRWHKVGPVVRSDLVARLNRRAIPVGLLEKLAHCTDPDCCIAHARGELRALLGKDSTHDA